MSNNNSIMNDYDMTNATIDGALTLIDQRAQNLDQWRTKELGLQVVLLGLAEVHALRLSRMAGIVYQLEEEVFSEENLREMDPRRMIELYEMSKETMNDSARYIKETISSVDWSNMEVQLLNLASKKSNASDKDAHANKLSDVANILLESISNKSNLNPAKRITSELQLDTDETENSEESIE